MSVPSLSLKGLRWKPALLALTTLVLVLSLAQAGQAQALTITTNALPDAVRGSPYMFTVQASGGSGVGYTWTAASTPPGWGLSIGLLTGTISGTTNTMTLSFNVSITVTDSLMNTANKSFTLNVNPPLSITTTTLPGGTTGVPYSQSVTATGGSGGNTWSISAGALPGGLNISNQGNVNGVISGTPTTAGTFNFTVRVADNGGRVATQALSIVIVAQLAITTTSLPDGTLGTAYSQTIAVTGGSGGNTWSISAGSLPAGLNISTQGNGNGLITGTPTTAGASSFTVRVADNGGRSATKDLAINVIAPPTIVTNALPQGVVNATYSATLDFTGGTVPNMWSVVSGSLPAGLNISTQTNGTGLISGMPTAAGTTNFTVRVVDSGGRSGTKDLSITISASLAITTNSLPLGVVNSPYTATVIAAGGSGGNSWAIVAGSGSLPTGLQISTAQGNGVISGTPTTAGTSSFTVRVTDSGGRTANQQLSITINASISVTTTSLPTGAVGRPYPPTQLGVAGGAGPYTWDIPSGSGSLPQGLTLSTQGTISGTPTTAGAASFTVRVTDSGSRTASQPLSIIVNDVLSIETTSPLPAATVGGLYSFQLQVRGGVGPYTWTTTPATVPPGMTFSAVGVLAGMPTTAGEFTFTATVSDSTAATASKSFQISVVSTAFGTLGFASTVPTAVNPTQQPEITLIVSTPTSQPIPGTLTLSFLSGGVGAADDPMVQFSTGSATSRTVSFTIPANSTAVTFPSKVTLITGTISGTVQMTADIQGGPTRVFVGSVTINSTIPQLTNISAVRVSQGLRVQITGYSPDRRVSNADFGIDVRTPSGTQRVNLSRDVNGDFDGWYRNAASVPFGSSFFYEQLFMVQGDVNTVDAVTVSLTNGEGKATSASVPFTN